MNQANAFETRKSESPAKISERQYFQSSQHVNGPHFGYHLESLAIKSFNHLLGFKATKTVFQALFREFHRQSVF